ncbi:DnaJ domain-containing protein [Chitinophaga oryziterrae]|uniref:DnaJ domain-containing protein n=1 Tax=Chitinophaga oryziterrae TaxID=1031224 RepID=A0A6N8J7H6_9BACT|nr:DnaJ domain-containing protein [Chitinophaga oryziterrae]MVT40236.1 DnaJ domain-containing protein [Chitinophaga oryziterrae]
MKFFDGCNTQEEVKARYRQLAMEHHPDKGGNEEVMKEINKEYEFICAKILAGENLNQEETEERVKDNVMYRDILEKLMALEGVVIEIIGLWIWVSGNTYPLRERLKKIGLKFAFKKKVWYYHPEYLTSLGRGNKTMDEIRAKFGSETVQGKYKGKKELHN